MTPYALLLYRRYKRGASVEAIAQQTRIPQDRVRQRLEAAAAFLRRAEARTDVYCYRHGRSECDTTLN